MYYCTPLNNTSDTSEDAFSSSALPLDFDLSPYRKVAGTIWSLLLYPDDNMHESYMQAIRDHFPESYAYITHTEDTWTHADEEANPGHKAGTLKKPHTHVVLYFDSERLLSALSKKIGIKPNFILKLRSYKKALRYLVHADHPSKYQYSVNDVQGPLVKLLSSLLTEDAEKEAVTQIIDLVSSTTSNVDLINKCVQKGLYSHLRRMGSLLNLVLAERPNFDQLFCWDCRTFAPAGGKYCARCGKSLNDSAPGFDDVVKFGIPESDGFEV